MSEIKEIVLKSLAIENFKSITKAHIDLMDGINIIIGENGAGKSNLLQFITTFVSSRPILHSRTLRQYNTSFTIECTFKKEKRKNHVFLKYDKIKRQSESGAEFISEIEINRRVGRTIMPTLKKTFNEKEARKNVLQDEDFMEETEFLRRLSKKYIRYNLPAAEESYWIVTPSKLTIDEEAFISIEELSDFTFTTEWEEFLEASLNITIDANDLVHPDINNFKSILIKAFTSFKKRNDVDALLNTYSPIESIRLNPNINIYLNKKKLYVENLIIDFKISGNWMPWSYLSDGTKRLFYLITEAIYLDAGIILIEEPELGIHPHQLYSIMQFIKEQSISKQIIISTHSPIVLDILSPNELDRITVAKMTDKGTAFNKLTKEQQAKAVDYIKNVGELSYYWLHSDLEND